MWRICRKTIFPRWHFNRQNPVDNKNQTPPCSKAVVLCPITQKKKSQNHKKKQHADKQDKRFWDDPNFHFDSCRSFLLETAGWVGTAAALCINVHLKHFKHIFDHDKPLSSCLLSRNVLAMPKHSISEENALLNASVPTPISLPEENIVKSDKVSSDVAIFESVRNLTDQYASAVQNSIGLSSLNKDNKKAFRCFQAAARLGSSQAFYNLGLCYELGKGTRVNLQRAAFCYRKAAMKGHGLASFNLAVYFMKGIGGLPVDSVTAKLLLAAAADQGVPEAQMYLGIELLEEGNLRGAFSIFDNLAKENFSDAQYYLGLCYENGWCVERNEKMAVKLYSKSAAQGNTKAIHKSKTYSKKLNGCNSNYGLTVALFQILRHQNNNISNHTVLQTNQDIEPSLIQPDDHGESRKNIHISASVPELASSDKILPQICVKTPAPSYLDLMIPLFAIKSDIYKPKASFSIGDDAISKDCSNSFLSSSLSSIPHVTQVKT